MKKQIIINASKDRSRIAIVEDGELVELYVENPDNVRTLGNIYLGKVQKVMPALRAAFVDVGLKQDAFLHFSDLTDNAPQLLAMAGEDIPGLDTAVLSLAPSKRIADDDGEADVEDSLEVEAEEPKSRTASRRRRGGRGRSRGGRSGAGRIEEEDEQEEGGEARPRRGALVIDLTSKPKPARPARPAAAEAVAAPTDTDGSEPAGDDDAPGADTPGRSRRRTRAAEETAPVAEVADEATPQADAAGGDAETDDAEDETRSRRRGGRRRGRGGKSDDHIASDETADEPSTDAPDADAAVTADPEADHDEDNRPARGRGSRRGARRDDGDDARTDDDGTDAAPSRSSRPAPEGRRRVDALLDAALGNLNAPVARRAPEPVDDEDDATDEAPQATERASQDDEPRGRRRSRADRDEQDDEAHGDDEPRNPRRSRGSRDESDRETTDTDEGDEPRSRRRSRSGRRDEPTADRSETSDSGASEEMTSDNATDDTDRAPRGRRLSGRDSGRDSARSPSKRESESPDREPSGRSRSDASRGDSSRSSDSSRGDASRGSGSRSESKPRLSGGKLPPTEELLRRDGRVLVKVTKEPISSKGSRVSTDLSLAGRFLVLVPAADYVAVSKKIESAKERRRLRTLAQSLKPEGFGVIVRTVAEGRDAKSLDTDLRLLADKWRSIEKKLEGKPQPPVLLYEDVNMVSSIIRDLFSDDFDRILVDDPKVFKNVQAYVKAVAPQMADKVELHRGSSTAFRAAGIERQVEEAFSKRVNMRGGGYLFIETTEAMHVVDVNSGRAGRGKSQKDNLIAVNVEAAREVAKQLRLRDLGGIIVVDFIDLKYERDRKKVTDALKEAFAKDRAVTKLLPMSDFGLVQITRQRLRPSITTQATDEDGEPLDAAEAARLAGAGEIAQPERRGPRDVYGDLERAAEDDERRFDDRRTDDRRDDGLPRLGGEPMLAPEASTPEALAAVVRGWLDRYRASVDDKYKKRPIQVRVHPLLGAHLRRGLVSPVARWKMGLRGIPFQLQDDASVHPLAFDVRDEKSGRSLLKKYTA